jgi:hypothetical protein
MKRIIINSFLLALVILPSAVYAHELAISGTIGAVMHVDPEDNPVAGEMTTFNFEFKDSNPQHHFNLNECNCEFNLTQDKVSAFSQTVDSSMIVQDSTLFIQHQFGEAGLYHITITGTPKIANAFDQFSLAYDLEVQKGSVVASATSTSSFLQTHLVHILLFGIGMLVVLIMIFKDGGDKK